MWEIFKGPVSTCLGYISGYSLLLLVDLVIPGVELGGGGSLGTYHTEKAYSIKPLRRIQMKQQRIQYLLAITV